MYPRGISPTPSEQEAMAAAASAGPLAMPTAAATDEALLHGSSAGDTSGPLRPVYSSDSLIALAAQESFSGLGAVGATPAYPTANKPRMVGDDATSPNMPPFMATWPPPPVDIELMLFVLFSSPLLIIVLVHANRGQYGKGQRLS